MSGLDRNGSALTCGFVSGEAFGLGSVIVLVAGSLYVFYRLYQGKSMSMCVSMCACVHVREREAERVCACVCVCVSLSLTNYLGFMLCLSVSLGVCVCVRVPCLDMIIVQRRKAEESKKLQAISPAVHALMHADKPAENVLVFPIYSTFLKCAL
jgi:hypothetical protein